MSYDRKYAEGEGMEHTPTTSNIKPRAYNEETSFIERIDANRFKIKVGFVPNMKVPCSFYINSKLESMMFDELRAFCTSGGVGGFLPAVKQLANVASLPGIVGNSVGLPDVHSGYGFAIGNVAAFDMSNPDAIVSPGGVGFDINCIAAGTLINLSCGISVPIEHLKRCPRVQAHSRELHGVVCGDMLALHNNGHKECIELIFEDGRKLVCTPDHKILLDNNTFVKAIELIPKQSMVQFGVQSPCGFDGDTDRHGIQVQWKLHLKSLNVTLAFQHGEDRRRSMAFARVIGLLLTDGTITRHHKGTPYARIFVGHSFDVTSVLEDIEIITNGNARVYPTTNREHTMYEISLPIQLVKSLIELDPCFAPGDRMLKPYLLPTFLFEPNVPTAVVREFLGGMMGGDGLSPVWHTRNKYIKLGGFVASKVIQNHHQLTAGLAQLCNLFNKFGVDARMSSNSYYYTRKSDGVKCVYQKITIYDIVTFNDNIGIRHCGYKAVRFSAAAAFFRFRNLCLNQCNQIINKVEQLCEYNVPVPDDFTCIDCNKQFKNESGYRLHRQHQHNIPTLQSAIDQTADEMEGSIVDHNVIPTPSQFKDLRGNNHTKYENFYMDIKDWCMKRNILKIFKQDDEEEQQVLLQDEQVEQLSQQRHDQDEDDAIDESTPKRNKSKPFYCVKDSLPTFNLKLTHINKLNDTRPVYDLSVQAPYVSYVANGVVVHNCGVRLLRTNLHEDDVKPVQEALTQSLFDHIPVGVGSKGVIPTRSADLIEALEMGMDWSLREGYAWAEDKEHCEEYGRMLSADPSKVSTRAKKRGLPQLGTLGAGNHYCEIQVVDEIFDKYAAAKMGIHRVGQVCIMIHSGSRGLGHQVATDALVEMEQAMSRDKIHTNDRQLACARIQSQEGRDYLAAMSAAANYAWVNRSSMTFLVRQAFSKQFKTTPDDLDMHVIYDVSHNIAKMEEHYVNGERKTLLVHRKGATRALPPHHPLIPVDYQMIGQPVLIGGTMGTCSYVLTGTEKGMTETFGSTCHGAGRAMSRNKSRKQLDYKGVLSSLVEKGISIRVASPKLVMEEAPESYKDVIQVVETCHAAGISKKCIKLRPIAVVKG